MFVPVGGGPLGGVRGRGGGTLHWTLRWLPLPVVTHALPRDERLPCVDLLTLPPSVLKARGIADVTHTSLITHVHVCGRERLLHTRGRPQLTFIFIVDSSAHLFCDDQLIKLVLVIISQLLLLLSKNNKRLESSQGFVFFCNFPVHLCGRQQGSAFLCDRGAT